MSIRATCELGPGGKPCHGGVESTQVVTGNVTLEQPEGGQTTITWSVSGLAPGPHGFHM